jgi:hypothetical protein
MREQLNPTIRTERFIKVLKAPAGLSEAGDLLFRPGVVQPAFR